MSVGIGPPRTIEELRRRLEDCALTMRYLPPSRGTAGPQGFRSTMPSYVHDNPAESYGYQRATVGRIVASASEIARMDEVFGWMTRWWSHDQLRASHLPRDAGVVAFERCGLRYPISRIRQNRLARWPGMAPPGGVSAPSIRAIEHRALTLMLVALGADPREIAAAPVEQPRVQLDVVVDFGAQERVRGLAHGGGLRGYISHARAVHRLVSRPAWED
jgi:hypothetical protein